MAMDDKIKAMKFGAPDNIPVNVGILPAAWMKYRGQLDAIVKRHPVIFANPAIDKNYDEVGGTYVAGSHTDVWGCVWENVATGHEAIVRKHPYPTRESVHTLKPPEKDAGIPHGFMYLRLADLRGFEEIMIDFAEEPPELQALIDIVLNYNVRQLDIMLRSRSSKPGGFIWFGDDLGTQHALPISPEKWRKYLKPCYRKLYQPVRAAGHYVYMHTDGHIYEIIPDLIECGVDVVNPQVRANGLDNLARVCKGKVCVDLDLDRQMFPFCTPGDIDSHVREAVETLGSPEGGLWLNAEIDDGVPLENVEAICSALEKYRGFYSR